MEQIIDGISHSEAELAESKNPAEKPVVLHRDSSTSLGMTAKLTT